MAAEESNEDVPYEVDSFAMEERASAEEASEGISSHDGLVVALREYLDKAIAEHNSFDVLNVPQNATPEEKVAVFDEMFNHKGIVHHLRQLKETINDKVREN